MEYPPELLENCDEAESLVRVAKFAVLSELRSSGVRLTDEASLKIATNAYQNGGFIAGIRKRAPLISRGEIELTADYLGYYDVLWPPRVKPKR